jgi:uncharacterized protein (TIGR02466 family)
MNIECWFPTPILIHQIDDSKREIISEKVDSWATQENIAKYLIVSTEENLKTSYHATHNIIEICDLLELYNEIIYCTNYFCQAMGLSHKASYTIHSWINFFEKNQTENQHTHYGSFLSGCYYVKAPKGAGNIVFPDATAERDMWKGIYMKNKLEENPLNTNSIGYEPIPGKLIMFQSWMPHSVSKNNSDDTRISIAFNVNRND